MVYFPSGGLPKQTGGQRGDFSIDNDNAFIWLSQTTLAPLEFPNPGRPRAIRFDRHDIRAVLKLEQVHLSPDEFERFYRQLDRDRDGLISLTEYLRIPLALEALLRA